MRKLELKEKSTVFFCGKPSIRRCARIMRRAARQRAGSNRLINKHNRICGGDDYPIH